MSAGKLLGIEPLELKFTFELKKQSSSFLQLSNKTDSCVAFKVRTTTPKKYCVRPNTGIVLPRSTCDVIVIMQAHREASPDMQCKDKFLIQSVKTIDGTTAEDITAEMFNKEAGNVVEECKLRVVYVSPPQPPSPVTEGSEDGSPPRDSVLEYGNFLRATVTVQIDGQEKSSEMKALIAKLTDEKENAIQQNNKLRLELELLRRECNKNHGGISLRAFLDALTLAKIHVLGHDYLKDLLKVIDPGNLPTFVGRNCTCSDYGNCLVNDRGPRHDREILEILEAVALDQSLSFDDKIRGLKAVVKEAETKLESLQSIAEDAKMVMKSLTHLIEDLKKSPGNSNFAIDFLNYCASFG